MVKESGLNPEKIINLSGDLETEFVTFFFDF